jgi:hypothetical protein
LDIYQWFAKIATRVLETCEVDITETSERTWSLRRGAHGGILRVLSKDTAQLVPSIPLGGPIVAGNRLSDRAEWMEPRNYSIDELSVQGVSAALISLLCPRETNVEELTAEIESDTVGLYEDPDETLADFQTPPDYRDLVVYSRDWTVATVIDQITSGNIKLDPEFQRRNAWTDDKRSGLIESLIAGIPVPQLVFAEKPDEKRSFIVIDGRQRLMTLWGYIDTAVPYWQKHRLSGLNILPDLDGVSFAELANNPKYRSAHRELMNADVRCAIISSRSSISYEYLYYVFYRLNSGSVSLSPQELRQSLYRGEFTKYLDRLTSKRTQIHDVLGLSGPDPRYRDSEIMLRYFAQVLHFELYRGNLRSFLDEVSNKFNADWLRYREKLELAHESFENAIRRLIAIFGGATSVGRRPMPKGTFDRRFNRAIFETQIWYIRQVSDKELAGTEESFRNGFIDLYSSNNDFRSSVSVTTKSLDQYRVRFKHVAKLASNVFGRAFELPEILIEQ